MNSGYTTERVYDALKRRLLGGEVRPGARLEPALLSDTLGSSATPVRDALNILTGETLVEARSREGFFVPHLTEVGLRDLYAWNAEVVSAVLRATATRRTFEPSDLMPSGAPVEEVLSLMNSRTGNAEHYRAIVALNDRLALARSVEPQVLRDQISEMQALVDTLNTGDAAASRRAVSTYHKRRIRAAAEIVAALYRGQRSSPSIR